MRQRDFWRAHLADVMTFDAFHGRLYRARKGIRSQAHLFTHDLGAPWRLTGGDWLIVGDVQLPTTNYDYAGTLMAIAEKHLRKPRKLILAGNFINADAFSDYDSDIQTPRFEAEVDAAETLIFEFLKVFTDVACKRFSCACPCVHGEARRCVGFRCNPVVPPCRRATRQRWPADGEAVNGPPAGTAIVDPFRVDDGTAVSASAQACTSTSYPQYTPTPYPVNGRSNTARLDAAYMNGLRAARTGGADLL